MNTCMNRAAMCVMLCIGNVLSAAQANNPWDVRKPVSRVRKAAPCADTQQEHTQQEQKKLGRWQRLKNALNVKKQGEQYIQRRFVDPTVKREKGEIREIVHDVLPGIADMVSGITKELTTTIEKVSTDAKESVKECMQQATDTFGKRIADTSNRWLRAFTGQEGASLPESGTKATDTPQCVVDKFIALGDRFTNKSQRTILSGLKDHVGAFLPGITSVGGVIVGGLIWLMLNKLFGIQTKISAPVGLGLGVLPMLFWLASTASQHSSHEHQESQAAVSATA